MIHGAVVTDGSHPRRVLAIGLDGLEVTLADRLMDAGELPGLRALRERSARFLLDHGRAQSTGLAWEHFATGLGPEQARRWGAIDFDPNTYAAWQSGARFRPFFADLGARTTVFDPPYVRLEDAPDASGITGWGAHDPGVPASSRPTELLGELEETVSSYPASASMYATPWPSAEACAAMGDSLAAALETRTRAAMWLAGARLSDWELFIVVSGELHSATEGLWHGIRGLLPFRN